MGVDESRTLLSLRLLGDDGGKGGEGRSRECVCV
jgi:hypothetical protein